MMKWKRLCLLQQVVVPVVSCKEEGILGEKTRFSQTLSVFLVWKLVWFIILHLFCLPRVSEVFLLIRKVFASFSWALTLVKKGRISFCTHFCPAAKLLFSKRQAFLFFLSSLDSSRPKDIQWKPYKTPTPFLTYKTPKSILWKPNKNPIKLMEPLADAFYPPKRNWWVKDLGRTTERCPRTLGKMDMALPVSGGFVHFFKIRFFALWING